MNELTEKKTPEQLGAEIRMYVDAGRRISLLCGIEIGKRLAMAKELLEHGEWLPWLEKETEFSDRSAQRYMKLYEEYGASQLGLFGPETNTPTLSDLPISKAFALLSVPESERAEFAEEVDARHISVRELEQAIREKQEAEQRLDAMRKDMEGEQAALDEARKQIEELAKLNRELESRPVEVAVETIRDEEAIAAAAKEAREKAEAEKNRAVKQYEKTVNELNRKLLAAEKERDEAKAAGRETETERKLAEAEQQAEKIRAELKEAYKKLEASDADVTKFGVWFGQVQKDFLEMMEALRQVGERDPELHEKLRIGAATLLRKLLERMGT